MTLIKIITKYGTEYKIDSDGCFLQYNEHSWEHPHDSWKCTGCAEVLAFGHLRGYSLKEFIAMIKKGEIRTFKNGNPRFTLTDIDHGTRRVHGNVKWHGIKYAYIEEE